MNNGETENQSLGMTHVDWLLRSFLDQLYAMYGNELWSYGGYYDRDELAKRIRMLGPDYENHFLPADVDELLSQKEQGPSPLARTINN